MSSKNSSLPNLEEDFFSMMNENVSLLSETTSAQRTAERQANDETISEKITNDGAKTATDCIAPDDNGRISPSVKRKRGEEKSAFPERRSKQVSKQSGKAVTKTPANKGAENGSNLSKTLKTARTVPRTDKGGKTACSSTSAKTVNMTQLSDILQSSLSTAFDGLTESMKTGFADLGKLIQDTKITEDKEISSESEVSDDECSDKNEPDEPPAKRQKTADPHPAIIEKFTKELALEDEKGPDINTQLAGLAHKLLRDAKPNETKLNDLKKKYIPPNNCEGLSETRVNISIWNNLDETARSNGLKLQKVQKYLIKGMTAVVTVIDALVKDESNLGQEDNIGKLMVLLYC